MDDTDRRILRILQTDCSAPVSEVARQVGLSASPCWKRINRLQETGVIREQVHDPRLLRVGHHERLRAPRESDNPRACTGCAAAPWPARPVTGHTV